MPIFKPKDERNVLVVLFSLLVTGWLVTMSSNCFGESISRFHADWVETLVPEGEGENRMLIPAVVDLTGDGLEDIVYFGQLPNCCLGEYTQDPEPMHIMVRNEDGIMENRTEDLINGPTSFPNGNNLIFPADYNGDGRMDLFLEVSGQEVETLNDPGGQNRLLLMGEDGRLLDVTDTHLPQWMDKSHFSGIGDFDGDGDVDIFVNHLGGWDSHLNGLKRDSPGGTGYLMFNDGTGHFEVVADFAGGIELPVSSVGPNGRLPEDEVYGGHWAIIPIDADGDGDLDIVLGDTNVIKPCPTLPQCETTEERVILMNDGTGRFSRGPENMVPELEPPTHESESHRIENTWVADINNDGLDDLLATQLDGKAFDSGDEFSKYLQILISNGDGTFRDESAERHTREYVAAPCAPVLRDFDRDGYLDLLCPEDIDGIPGSWWQKVYINDGEGYFRDARHIFYEDAGVGPDLITLDVDGDDEIDYFDVCCYWWAEKGAHYVLHKMNAPYGPELDGRDDSDFNATDYLIGGAHDNVYRGLEGNDVLDGGLGDDYLDGGPGDDELIGGKGDDRLIPGFGTDSIDGGPDRDSVEYDYPIAEAEILYDPITLISSDQNSSNDQVKTTEYALFSDAATPLPTKEQSTIKSLNGVAGLWYDPDLDGEGFNVITTPSGTVIFFYGFNSNGERLWLISENLVNELAFEQVFDLQMYEATGGTFAQPAPSSESLNEWGRLKGLFDACGSGRFALHGADGVKTTYQTKLAGITNADCQVQTLSAPSGLAGLWYDPVLEGEGYNVIITENVTVILFYGYAADGERLWLISESMAGAPVSGETATLRMFVSTDGTFDEPLASSEVLKDWGQLEITIGGCGTALAKLAGDDGEKNSSLVKLAGIEHSACP